MGALVRTLGLRRKLYPAENNGPDAFTKGLNTQPFNF